MDHYKKLSSQVYRHLLTILLLNSLATGIILLVLLRGLNLDLALAVAAVALGSLLLAVISASMSTGFVLQPIHMLWQSILHIAPGHTDTAAPDIAKARIGRELLSSLTLQVYQFASQQDGTSQAEHRREVIQSANVVSHMPIPLFVFNKSLLVTNASDSAMDYCQLESAQLFGKPLFDSLNLEFPSNRTLETWIADCQDNKVTDNSTWERVRVVLNDGKTVKQCDIAAVYSRDNPSGTEFIVTLFDRTGMYDQDDQSLSFVALAVHELRTPLTMLRGYIEVFEDELGDKLDNEMKDFMYKMRVSAQQLTAFINNILNVARVEENQLTLHLVEQKWDELLTATVKDAQTRAKVHGKNITLEIEKVLPTVAVDPVSVTEVINNLVDNAIKYSAENKEIIIRSIMRKDGLVETTVQDFGVGIPESVLPNLFEKFYRNHRTRAQIGGTGLGLYLCKALIGAHGGQVWANSKEGEGSTFGFTLLPYSSLADELKTGNNDIVRGAHGWIKNHSLYRR